MSQKRARPADWELIRAEYETGTRSLRELATNHGVSKDSILRRKKAEGWVENLSARVKTHRNRKIVELDAEEFFADHPIPQNASETAETRRDSKRDSVAVSAAERQVEIVKDHRRMLGELREVSCRQLALIRQWLYGNEEERKDAAGLLFVRRSDSLVAHLNSASAMITRIITSEREAYGLNERDPGELDQNEAEVLRDEIRRRMGAL